MHRRHMMDSLDDVWMALCVWFLRRSPLPPVRSHRLLARLSGLLGLPCPVAVPVRGR